MVLVIIVFASSKSELKYNEFALKQTVTCHRGGVYLAS